MGTEASGSGRDPAPLHYSHEEIAVITNRTMRDAVRMAVQRSLRRLTEVMDHER